MRSQCSAQSGGWLVPCDQELLLLMINRVGNPAPEGGGWGARCSAEASSHLGSRGVGKVD